MGEQAMFEALGHAVERLGEPGFHAALLDVVDTVLPGERRQVVHFGEEPPLVLNAFWLTRARGAAPWLADDHDIDEACGARLTPREREIVRLMLRGLPCSLIARHLGVREGTVRNHRLRLYAKLDINSERELLAAFVRA